jgi:hypothetical protein
MAAVSRQYRDGLPVALAIHLGIYCAVASMVALGVYELMQPTRIPNPGLAAFKPPPATVMTYVPGLVPNPEVTTAAASLQVAPETDGVADRAPVAEAKPPKPEARAERPKRSRSVQRPERRDPMRDFAARQYFGGGSLSWGLP